MKKHVQPVDDVRYREWSEFLRNEDVVVSSRDPLASFLAEVSRSDAAEAVGGRSVRYRLRAVAQQPSQRSSRAASSPRNGTRPV